MYVLIVSVIKNELLGCFSDIVITDGIVLKLLHQTDYATSNKRILYRRSENFSRKSVKLTEKGAEFKEKVQIYRKIRHLQKKVQKMKFLCGPNALPYILYENNMEVHKKNF